jgi:hypothetical protein
MAAPASTGFGFGASTAAATGGAPNSATAPATTTTAASATSNSSNSLVSASVPSAPPDYASMHLYDLLTSWTEALEADIDAFVRQSDRVAAWDAQLRVNQKVQLGNLHLKRPDLSHS